MVNKKDSFDNMLSWELPCLGVVLLDTKVEVSVQRRIKVLNARQDTSTKKSLQAWRESSRT